MESKIVNLDGLADILICSKESLMKTWRQYPHFFIGLGGDARGARFDANDVIDYLKERDYADMGQKDKELRRPGKNIRSPSSHAVRFSNQGGRQTVGAKHKTRPQRKPAYSAAGDPFDLLRGIK